MARTITQSILAAFVSSGNGDFSGSQGLWFGRIPANLGLPFLAFVHGGESMKSLSEKQYYDMGTFTFSVFAETIEETENLGLKVLAIYDAFIDNWTGLNFTGGKVAEWKRTRNQLFFEPIESADNVFLGRQDIQYAYTTQKTLP